MKILISVFGNMAESNGTTIRAKRINEVLSRKNEVTVFSMANSPGLVKKTSSISKTLRSLILPFYLLFWQLKLISCMAMKKFEVLYCVSDFRSFPLLYVLSKIKCFKIIFEAHGVLSQESENLGKFWLSVEIEKFLERFVIKRADYVVSSSINIHEYYLRFNKKMELVTVNSDTGRIKMSKEAAQNVRKKYGITKKEKLIGVIGPFSIDFNKNSLEFLSNNKDKFDKRIKLIALGKNETEIKGIIFTGYIPSYEEYINHICALDAFVAPIKISTSGPLNKIVESMACERPVFTTPEGFSGLDFAKNNVDIIVLPEKDMVDGINKLIFNEKLMATLGKNARKMVIDHFSYEANEKNLQKILDFLAKKNL